MESFEKIKLSQLPLCPKHTDDMEIANIICIDPACNPDKKKAFKILCPECEHTENIHKDNVKNKPHSIKSLVTFLNHIVSQANSVGENHYTYTNLMNIMDEIIDRI